MSVTIDIDLRDRLGEARDQRQRPTCLAFAASGAHEASRAANEYLSVEFLFYGGAQHSHRDPKRGLTVSAVRDALQLDGQPAEIHWPYLPEHPDAAAWKPPGGAQPFHKATLDFAPRTTADVRGVLSRGKPVLIVFAVTTAMYRPNEDAVVRAHANDVVTARRHAVLAVGSGHADDGEYILVRNSWGPRWGDKGHAWLHDPYVSPQLHTTAVIT